jgi:ABC-type multidrug transport system fused ATPase/permease subunit
MSNYFEIFVKIFQNLTSEYKKKIIFFPLLIIGVALLELLSIAIVIPLTTIILSEDIVFFGKKLNFFFSDNILFYGIFFIIGLYSIKSLYLIFFNYWRTYFASNLTNHFNTRLFSKYLSQEYVFFLKSSVPSLVKNLNLVQNFVINIDQFAILVTEITILLTFFAFLFFYNSYISFMLILIILTLSFIYLNFFLPVHGLSGIERQISTQNLYNNFVDPIKAVKDIKIVGTEKYFIDNFNFSSITFCDSLRKHEFTSSIPKVLIEFFLVVIFMITVSVMYVLNYKTNEIIIYLSLFAFVGFKFIPSINKIIFSITHLKFYLPLSKELIKDLNLKDHNLLLNQKKIIKYDNDINIKNLSFSYNNTSNYILQNINLKIKKNEVIGIVGETGSGKSTFINILLGLLKPTNGKILIDDELVNLNSLPWRVKIGFVSQKINLLNNTIKNNILLGRDIQKFKSNIVKSLKISQSYNFLKKYKNFLNYKVGEDGSKLSGGQAQRLAIARSVLENPDILIFDEPTSSLDKITEDKLIRSLKSLIKNKTVIISSHNNNILKICNNIYEFKNKKIYKR